MCLCGGKDEGRDVLSITSDVCLMFQAMPLFQTAVVISGEGTVSDSRFQGSGDGVVSDSCLLGSRSYQCVKGWSVVFQVMPLFVMQTLGDFPGLPGLFVACVYSAALR